ncbi:MAG TPA: gluconate 2-dehydrogenase subunit 3 family protein [Sphingobium sp.]
MINRRTMLKVAGATSAAGTVELIGMQTTVFAAEVSTTSTGEAPLGQGEFALVAAMAEGIIPKTDTPGAIGAGVPEFFRLIFDEWFLKDQQTAFRASLQSYDQQARDLFGHAFVKCSASEQMQLLTEWDKKGSNPIANPPHPFGEFKRLTLHGYYTSQVGQNEELKTTMDGAQDNTNGPVMYGIAGMF